MKGRGEKNLAATTRRRDEPLSQILNKMPYELKITKLIHTQDEFDAMLAGTDVPSQVMEGAREVLKTMPPESAMFTLRVDNGSVTQYRAQFRWDKTTSLLVFHRMVEDDNPPLWLQHRGGTWVYVIAPPSTDINYGYLHDMFHVGIYMMEQNKGRQEQGIPLLTYPHLDVTTYEQADRFGGLFYPPGRAFEQVFS